MSELPPVPKFVLRGCEHPVNSIAFLNNKQNKKINFLVSGTQNGECYLWDLKTKCLKIKWKAHNYSVLWLKSLELNCLWSCGRNEAVIMWDIDSETPKEKLRFNLNDYHGFSQSDIIKHGSHTMLVIPGPSQEDVTIWDVDQTTKFCLLVPSDNKSYGSVMQCKWIIIQDKLFILIAYENGNISLWDLVANNIITEIKINENPISMEYEAYLKQGVCGTASEKVFIFSLNENEIILKQVKTYSITNPGIGCIALRPDGKIYATGGWDYRIRLFSWKSHKPLAVLLYHKSSIENIQFSKLGVESLTEGYLLAVSSSDHSISLWDIYN